VSHTALLSPEALEANFAEIAPQLTRDAAVAEAHRCLYCFDAPCTQACPTHIDVPAFIKKIATGNLRGAARVIFEANPMGHSCALACPVEVLCEGSCVLDARDEKPINIARLQRVATDWALANGVRLFRPGPPTGKRVAIVGAGPAGLSAARELRRFGHAVTMFEAKPLPGGLNTYGIAEYKMRPRVALTEVQSVLDLGVELRSGMTVGLEVTLDQLLADYHAVLLAVGLGLTRRLGIPGEDLPGVVDALAFIETLKTRPYAEVPVGKRVVVIGAGNTAIDAVTQAKRLGAEHATIVYRRGETDMPAYDYEYEIAKSDGCDFRFYCVPRAIVGNARVQGLEVETPAGWETIACDMVIKALGQTPRGDFSIPEGNPKVFMAGDCANGGKEIVNAAAEGVAAAKQIHRLLEGRDPHGRSVG
jgi:glutamate synthase (NADPH/NADH) small chain